LDVKGIIPPLITPFTKDGDVYEEGLRRFLDFQIEKGVHGIWLCGTYGAGPLITIEQRKKITEICVDQVNKRIPVMVHVGSSSIDSVLDLAKHAEDVGADAIGSVPPFYYPYKENEVFSFYDMLISSVGLPVFAYNNPGRTGFNIQPEFLNKLADIGLVGVKDSSFSLPQFYEYLVTVVKKGFIFIVGTEALLLPALITGAKGCISGLANAFPELNVEAYNAIENKDWKKAVELQLKITRARKIMHVASSISACYTILKMRGIDVGFVKKPVSPLTKSESEYVEKKFKALGLL